MAKGRRFKNALFQPVVKEGKAAALPKQQFKARGRLIDKDKSIALLQTFAQLITDNTAQTVKAFTHISLFAVQVVPCSL